MSQTPLLTAVVLNYRTPKEVARCVHALRAQTVADRMEVLVIDNHSEDDSIGLIRSQLKNLPGVRILETPQNAGFGSGYNLGIGQARGRYLLLNNPAKLLSPGSAEKMMHALDADGAIGILGPQLLYDDGTIRDSYRSFPKPLDVVIKRTFLGSWFPKRMRRYLQWDENPDAVRDVDWVIGGCLMMRADLAKRLQGFDPRYFLFFEDMDLCRRCWHAGLRVVYFPLATATDRKRRLSEGGVWTLLTTRTGRAHIASALKYFWKWRGDRVGRGGASPAGMAY